MGARFFDLESAAARVPVASGNGGVALRRVGIVLPPETDLIDVAGPSCVFSSAARCLTNAGASADPLYVMDYLSVPGGLVDTRQGLMLDTRALRGASPADYDTIIVTGGDHTSAWGPDDIAGWLADARPLVRRIASVCTGAFFLARAGLLHGKRATTHWMDCGQLARQFRSTLVDGDAIFVEDGGVWTSAGATAGIDMALAMVEQDYGHDLAMTVARMQVVFLKRHGGQSQYSVHLQSQETQGPLSSLLRWIVAHPRADLSIEALAERAHMSVRNFYRGFEAATGQSPGVWVEAIRVENAKRLLSQTTLKAEQIAMESGFGSYERMRRTFTRSLGISPRVYRERFGRLKGAAGAPGSSLARNEGSLAFLTGD
jgi:transcriptional regulator GlxA family with amidase domain